MASDKTELTISRLIDAPSDLIWQAWSDPALLEKWWIPAPYECKVVKMDLRPGGGFVTAMRAPGEDFQPHAGGCFLEVIQGRRLVFTTALTEGWYPTEPWLALTAIIDFTPEGQGTRYSARVLHKNAEDSHRHEEMGFQQGWGATLEQLSALVQTMK